MNLIESYRSFLDKGKTERECVKEIIKLAEKEGYRNIESTDKLHAGDKVYYVQYGKSIALFNIGKDDIENGMNILGAHIDSPRLDVKMNPVYENENVVYLDTHYYGGIKKYQWVTLQRRMEHRLKSALEKMMREPSAFQTSFLTWRRSR